VKLSVVIPAQDEAQVIAMTLRNVTRVLDEAEIEYEVIVVDDASTDDTSAAVEREAHGNPRIRLCPSRYSRGYGQAVRAGLDCYEGDAVAVVMADGSDDPRDLVRYHALLLDGYDCAFGSRFVRGSQVTNYPRFKLVLNRVVNWGIRIFFRLDYNDTTNAFKAYRREVIDSIQPLLSHHFNLTVEMPLKAIVRGHSYGVVPIAWRGRASGASKLSLQEMGSRYLFIVLYVFLEHHLSRGDYRAKRSPAATHPTPAERQPAGHRWIDRVGTWWDRAPPG
jgi:dolichol-phosphate mannosyltransferase